MGKDTHALQHGANTKEASDVIGAVIQKSIKALQHLHLKKPICLVKYKVCSRKLSTGINWKLVYVQVRVVCFVLCEGIEK